MTESISRDGQVFHIPHGEHEWMICVGLPACDVELFRVSVRSHARRELADYLERLLQERAEEVMAAVIHLIDKEGVQGL